jgi:SPP1 gp7 family putative phage head morphogenesis protein
MLEVAPYARAAYAQGWAASGGPMTDRVKAGCVAAVGWACDNADSPDVLEVALKLGSLEGTWALIFARRDALIAKWTGLVQKAWNDTLQHLDVGAAVQRFRHAVGLAEANDWLKAAKSAARDAMVSLLSWLPGTVTWQALRAAMGGGIAAAVAEGRVDAIALAWEAAGKVSMDFDLAFTHAYDALENLGQIWTQSDTWLGRMLDTQTSALGQTLGDLAGQGASYEEMLSAAQDLLTGVEGDAVGFIVDWALNTGMSQGALDLYRSEGVQEITFMTAGDERVCPQCEQAEVGSPYSPVDLPTPPLHPRCRCTIVAELSLPGSLERYLAGQ